MVMIPPPVQTKVKTQSGLAGNSQSLKEVFESEQKDWRNTASGRDNVGDIISDLQTSSSTRHINGGPMRNYSWDCCAL